MDSNTLRMGARKSYCPWWICPVSVMRWFQIEIPMSDLRCVALEATLSCHRYVKTKAFVLVIKSEEVHIYTEEVFNLIEELPKCSAHT